MPSGSGGMAFVENVKLAANLYGVSPMEFATDITKIFDSRNLFQELFTELMERYAENPDGEDDILIEVTRQDGRTTTSVTVNGNTYHVSDSDQAFGKLYELLAVKDLSDFASERGIAAPVPVHKIDPIYPETAKEAGVSGSVMLTVMADDKGETISVSVVAGLPELSEAAIAAVSQWRYDPALSSEGIPVPVRFGVVARFLPDGMVNSEVSSVY